MTVTLDLDINPTLWIRTDFVAPVGRRLRSCLPSQANEFYDEFRRQVRMASVPCLQGPLRLRLEFSRRCSRAARGAISSLLRGIEIAGEGVLYEDWRQIREVEIVYHRFGPRVRPQIRLELTQLTAPTPTPPPAPTPPPSPPPTAPPSSDRRSQ